MPWQAPQVADLAWPAFASPHLASACASVSETVGAGAVAGSGVTVAAPGTTVVEGAAGWTGCGCANATAVTSRAATPRVRLKVMENSGSMGRPRKDSPRAQPRDYPRASGVGQRNRASAG